MRKNKMKHNQYTNENSQLNDEERTRCEVWTRVMGYHRPVTSFNPGKQSEYSDRKFYNEQASSVISSV